MGEYANYKGERVKIGTCEDMYYLRADQRELVNGGDAAANFSEEGLGVIRFRFPFPDEDAIEPGSFEDYDRGVRIPGYSLPETLNGSDGHSIVQFTSSVGYNVCLPCPEGRRVEGDSLSTDVDGLHVNRNSFNGGPVVKQQALRGGVWVTLVECGACGGMHRLDTIEDAEPVIEAFRTEADRQEWRRLSSDWDAEHDCWGTVTNYGFEPVHTASYREFLLKMAERITAGYLSTVPA